MKLAAGSVQLKTFSFILSMILIIVSFPKPVVAVQVNPFTEKWGTNLFSRSDVHTDFTSLVMPVTADVVGDGWHEIFLSLGYDHEIGDDGVVFCLDGHDGSVLWSYSSSYFGSHTCLELYDLDSDGDLELLATGYHHVVAFHAENGNILWEFTRMNNRQDKPAVILEEDGVVYVFTASHQGIDGIGLQKRFGVNGILIKQVAGPLHPCHGGLSCEDLDDDGEFEIICTDRDFGTGHQGVQCYDTDLNLLWSQSTVQCSSHLANIVDVNDDGIYDVVAMDQGDGTAGICVVDGSDGSQMSGKWSENLGLYAHYTPSIYDIDQDGNLELITSNTGPASVWDLETWSLDAELYRRDGFPYTLCKPPVIANVIGDSDMEMVFVTHLGFDIIDKNYDLVAYQDDGYDGRADRIVIQDIDDDGLNEIVAVMHQPGTGSNTYGFIQCLDTPGIVPSPAARSVNFLYSYRRNGVSMYVPLLGGTGSSNTPPVAYDDSYITDEDTILYIAAAGVLINDVDDDGPDNLSADLVTNVSGGMLTLHWNGSFVYDPDLNFTGENTFTYRAWDGENYSNTVTVTINVGSFNDTTSPIISDVIIVSSDANDTQAGFNWKNFTCVVSDDSSVDDVTINITYPDDSSINVSMTNLSGNNHYFYNTSLLLFYLYHLIGILIVMVNVMFLIRILCLIGMEKQAIMVGFVKM